MAGQTTGKVSVSPARSNLPARASRGPNPPSSAQLRYFPRAGTPQRDLVTQSEWRGALPFPCKAAARAAWARDVDEVERAAVSGTNGPTRAQGRKHMARVAGKSVLFHFNKEHETGRKKTQPAMKISATQALLPILTECWKKKLMYLS